MAELVNSGLGTVNPLEMMNSLSEMQLRLNQNRIFNMQLMANQAMGEVFAHAKSPEEAYDTITHSNLMPFAGAALGAWKNMQLLETQRQGEIQKQAQSGFDATLKGAIGAGMADYTKVPSAVRGYMATLSPFAAERDGPAMEHVLDGLMTGLDKYDVNDPVQRAAGQKEFNSRAVGYAMISGMTARELAGLVGTPTMVENVPGVQAPAVQGGGFIPAQVQGSPGGGFSSSVGSPQNGGFRPQASMGGLTNPVTEQPYQVTPGAPYLMGRNGQPVTDAIGEFKLPEALEKQDDGLQKEYEKELTQYKDAQAMKASLGQMRSAADRLSASDYLKPGFAGNFRGELAKMYETAREMFPNTFDTSGELAKSLPQNTADVQAINKYATQLSFQLENSYEGTGRHALGMLVQASQAIPGMENTPLGFKLLTAGLEAQADYQIARRDFKNTWISHPATQGHLIGAEEAFNQESPATAFVAKELKQYGLRLDSNNPSDMRFENDDALRSAINAGLLGKPGSDQERTLAKSFWDKMHPEGK